VTSSTRTNAAIAASLLARLAGLLITTLLLTAGPALAQATLKPDGQWRHLLTAGLNLNSGNTRSESLTLDSDSVRARDHDKWSANAQVFHSRNAGNTTAERARLTTQYNGDLSTQVFAFVQGAALVDRPANIGQRLSASTGLGLHLMKRDREFWDTWAGLSLARQRYVRTTLVDGQLRQGFNDAGMVLAQESSLRLSQSTSWKQKLVLMPSARDCKRMRSEFDTQLTVAISERLNLSTGLSLRHTSHPAPGLKRLDAAFVTGLSLRID